MFKTLFVTVFPIFFLCPTAVFGQQLTWEQFSEDFLNETNDNDGISDYQETMQILQDLHEHPLNLNTCSRDDLLQIPYLTADNVDSILSYVKRYGPVQTLQELQFVKHLNAFERSVVMLFTTVGSPSASMVEKQPWRCLEKGKQEVALTSGVPFYRRQGYLTTHNKKGETVSKKYVGDPYYAALRYRYQLSDLIDAGLTTEKDDGEAFCAHGNYPFDSYSFYLRYRSKKCLNTLLIGDYRIQTGLGLVVGSSFLSNALSVVSSSRTVSTNIYHHASTDEFNFLRGAASRLKFHNIAVILFASYRQLDAFTKDSAVTSLVRTGYHRLPSERSRKGNLDNTVAGVSLNGQWHFWHAGLTALYLNYSKPFMKGSLSYQRYGMEGQNFMNTSVHYSYERKSVNFGGEAAVSNGGGFALLHELRWRPQFNVRLFLQHRCYDRSYHAPIAKSYAAAGHLSNEHGVLAGLNIIPTRSFHFLFYADAFHFPSASFYADKASNGYSFNFLTDYDTKRFGTLQLRCSVKARQENVKGFSSLRYHYKQKLRLQISYVAGAVNMFTTGEVCRWQPSLGKVQWGRALLQRAAVKLSNWSLSLWGAWFHTDGYRSALSAYQPSLIYNLSFPSLFGHGLAGAVTAECKCSRRMIIAGKWSAIHYTNRQSVGTADRKILKPTKADMIIQLRYLF